MLAVAGQYAASALSVLGAEAAGGAVREVMVVAAGLAAIRLFGLTLFRLVLPWVGLRAPRIVEDLVVIAGYAAWGLVRLRFAGVDVTGIVATSAVITAIVAFSMQDTLGNILGGLALEFDSAFEIGDWIRVDEVMGRVVDIRWRSTSVETNDWETVIIPNSQLVRSKLTIVGRRQNEAARWRRWVRFDVGLAVAPQRVIDVVQEALRAARIMAVAPQPLPDCILTGFEHGYARYAVRYFMLDPASDDAVGAAVREHVLKALQRADIRMAVMEHALHLTTEDEEHRVAVRKRDLEHRIAVLKTVEMLRELSAEEFKTVAERLVFAPFAAGDVITRQGAVAHWLYILTEGDVDIVLQMPSPEEARSERGDADAAGAKAHDVAEAVPREVRLLTTLKAPDVFGEMGLMTGEPRRSTVIARTAVECYRLDKAAFEGILLARPGLVDAMSRILANRQVELERAQRGMDAEARSHAVARRGVEILGRIRQFFGIVS